jgi:multiple sugar transport system permease protein
MAIADSTASSAALAPAAPALTGTTDARPDRPDPGTSRGNRALRPLFVLVVAALAVLFTYPFVWLVSASLKPRSQVFDNQIVPGTVQPENYTRVFDVAPVAQWLMNSVLIGVLAAVSVVVSSALVAFGFAYFRFPGRGVLFSLVLATMMLPGAVTMIPTYLIWTELRLGSSQVPLWAGNLFASAFYIFLMRQFFLGIPRELFEAARVDGVGYFGLFRHIALPLCKPAMLVVFIFEFRASWTDLMKPLIYLRDTSLFTLPRGLKAILDQFGAGGEFEWEIVLAASVISTVPLIVLFFFAQRYFIEGIATQGRKG